MQDLQPPAVDVSRVIATRTHHLSLPVSVKQVSANLDSLLHKSLACWCRIYKPQAVVPDNKQIVWGWNHGVTVGALPVSMFANGHIFFTQRLYEVNMPHALGMGVFLLFVGKAVSGMRSTAEPVFIDGHTRDKAAYIMRQFNHTSQHG